MSAELMKSKFIRPSVCGIDYLWSYLMDFFQIFVVAPYGSENFKTLLFPQIAAESFQTFPEFSS